MNRRPSDELDRLLEALGPLTEDDMLVLVQAWDEQDEATRRRAWVKAKQEISRRGLDGSLDRARHSVGRWAAAGRSDYHGIGGLLGLPGGQARLRMDAAPAVLDAAAAILAESALEADEHAVLMRPWQSLNEPADERFSDGSPTI